MKRIYFLWFCRYSLIFRAVLLGAFIWSLSFYVSLQAVVSNFSSTPTFSGFFSRFILAFWETEMIVKAILPLFTAVALRFLFDSARRSYRTARSLITRLSLRLSL